MALSRRTGQRFQSSIWPGFVDAMTGLLMVLMFVLTIFTVVQFVLSDTISGQEEELSELSDEIAALASALGLEQDRSAGLAGQVGRLTTALSDARTDAEAQASLIDSLTAQRDSTAEALRQAESRITGFEAQVAGLLADRSEARDKVAALTADLDAAQAQIAEGLSEAEALQLALAQARSETNAEAEAARLAAARADALDALIADLRADAAAQQTQLSEAEAARLADAAAAEALREKLANSDAELTAMTLALEAQRKEAEDTLTLLAAARRAQESTDLELAAALAARVAAEAASGQVQSEQSRQAALLAEAQTQLSQEQALSVAAQRKVEALNQQVAQLRSEIGQLQQLLGLAEEAEREANVQITSLGEQLNTALARVAAEQRARAELEEAERQRIQEERDRLAQEAADLETYKSDFFGELRKIVAGTPGVQIAGDRFVFSSEVLFTRGKAELSEDGKVQIARVAETLRAISAKIPDGIDWIIRVDGHTDNEPLLGLGEFKDNWELSQARALSVVRFMVSDLGIPPGRLSANGFGEFRPLVPGDSAAARAQNRRIELKLTER